jgi:hypothetical protein
MITLRISGNVYRAMQTDLRRPHEFAAERVGFLFVRCVKLTGDNLLVLSAEYTPVKDEHYLDDVTVGARINGDAIRSAMQRVLDTQQGCFHVHLHEHDGKPGFSGTDVRELRDLIPTFQKVGAEQVHGALVLSDDSAIAVALCPGSEKLTTKCRITILDIPMRIV